MKHYPTLYCKDKKNKIRMWQCHVEVENNVPTITITHGEKEGKQIENKREVHEGKNIGKKNETSAYEQAIREADKLWKDKVEKENYVETLELTNVPSETNYAPMLAEKYDPNSKKKHKIDIEFPCYVQPKLDGIRCLSYLKKGKIENQSRKFKSFYHLEHINSELEMLFESYPGIIFDGELYNHSITFNQIAGTVKKEKIKEEDQSKLELIQYHIYDSFLGSNLSEPFKDRWKRLETLFQNSNFQYLVLVNTKICENIETCLRFHEEVTKEKYEGVMLRNQMSAYEPNRTRHLQKYKTFIDDEFCIVGYKQGDGNDLGCVVWKVVNKNGKEFDVRPAATQEERKEMYKNGKEYVGKMLTVKYQELSEYGIPRFPVGVGIRDYE